MSERKIYTNSFSLRSRDAKKKKRKKQIIVIVAILAICAVVVGTIYYLHRPKKKQDTVQKTDQVTTQSPAVTATPEPIKEPFHFAAVQTKATKKFPKSVVSKNGIVIDVDNGTILAQKGGKKQIYPASMTKILTVLVAAEHVTEEQMDDTVTITKEITDYCYANDCSAVSFAVGEKVKVRDLFYGTILPSGADAALGLAEYVAGSHKAFVNMMNEKLEEMGIAETTHFTNCVGLYNDKHYSTPYDMALILKAASENEWCQQVLNARKYTIKTKKHKKGIFLSNLFLRRIEDKDTHSEVLYAKTGFVNQSGNCAASMAKDEDGHSYICVTAGSAGSWRCIYDHVELYQKYIPATKKSNIKGE